MRGGSLDAFTGRDYTSYQAHVLDADLPLAVEILTDLVRRPLLRESDLELERNVILEEINGVDDTPDDLVFELHAAGALARASLRLLDPRHAGDRRRALGRRPALRCMHDAATTRGNCVIAAAGNVSHDQLLDRARARGVVRGRRPRAGAAARCRRRRPGAARPPARSGTPRRRTSCSAPTPSRSAIPRRFALAILINAFGGGMSSRLFQRVREELGLAYAVFAYKHFHQSSGQLGVYVGTQPGTADAAVDAIRAEYARLAREGLPAAELADGKQQLKGQVMLVAREPRRADGPAGRLHAARRRLPPARRDAGRRSTR